MNIVKKLIFVPLFLIVFAIFIYQFNPILSSYDFIFSLSLKTLTQLITICALITLSSIVFVLFSAISLNWKFVLPVAVLGSMLPLIFMDTSLAIVLFVGSLIALLLTFLTLDNTMKNYLNFQPTTLFGPSIKHLGGLLILAICLVYFLSSNKIIAQKGFQIPDSLIDTALKFAPQPDQSQSQISIPPDLLKQYGLDPSILESGKSLKTVQELGNNLIKQTIKEQIQNTIKPYLGFIPAILAVLLFLTLQSIISIINLFISPLLWIIFKILEKTGFVKFTEELRPVRKMVI